MTLIHQMSELYLTLLIISIPANYKNQDEIINTHFDLLGEKTKLLHLKDFKLVDGEVV